jgi:hypothetical protein
MADRLLTGPYKAEDLGGVSVPWFVLRFDQRGHCTSPATAEALLEELRPARYTDVFLFSHGWNNDWNEAVTSYQAFIDQFKKLCSSHGLPSTDLRPLLIGVYWPSKVLLSPGEVGPLFAGGSGKARGNPAIAPEDLQIQELADRLPEDSLEDLYRLAQGKTSLSEPEARHLAGLLAPLFGAKNDELTGSAEETDIEDLLRIWSRLARSPGELDESGEGGTVRPSVAGPQAAGNLGGFDPRWVIWAATVRQMKDRAGTVGARGVHKLLKDVLASCPARLHLVGHSYGCKVLLSAVCLAPLPRAVESALLLQPAISHLCFAPAAATGTGRDGGYHAALDPARVKQPILSTFSSKDEPLRRLFHLAVNRSSDLAEVQIAAASKRRYSALGGYGPSGLTLQVCPKPVPLPAGGTGYPQIPDPVRILALDGSQLIAGHGDVKSEATAWALYQQVKKR